MNRYYHGLKLPAKLTNMLLLFIFMEFCGKCLPANRHTRDLDSSLDCIDRCNITGNKIEIKCKDSTNKNTRVNFCDACTFKAQCYGNKCTSTDTNFELKCFADSSCLVLNCLANSSSSLECCINSTITNCSLKFENGFTLTSAKSCISTIAPTTTSITNPMSTTPPTTSNSNHNQTNHRSTPFNSLGLSEQNENESVSLIIGLTVAFVATIIIVIVVLIFAWRKRAKRKSGAKNNLELTSPVKQQIEPGFPRDFKHNGKPNLENNQQETNGHIYNEVDPYNTENPPYAQFSTTSCLNSTNRIGVNSAFLPDTPMQIPKTSAYTLARVPSDTKIQDAEVTGSYFLLEEENGGVPRNSVRENGAGEKYFTLEKDGQDKHEMSGDKNVQPETGSYSKLFETKRQANNEYGIRTDIASLAPRENNTPFQQGLRNSNDHNGSGQTVDYDVARDCATSKIGPESNALNTFDQDGDISDYTEAVNVLGNDKPSVYNELEKNSKDCQENVHGDGHLPGGSDLYSRPRENTKEFSNEYYSHGEVTDNMNNNNSKELAYQTLNADKSSDYSLGKII